MNISSFCEHGIPAVPCFVCDDLAKLRSILVQASAKHVRRVVVVTVAVVTSVINQGCGKRRSNRRTNQRTAKNAMWGFGSFTHSISLYGFANVPNLSKSGKPRSILFLRWLYPNTSRSGTSVCPYERNMFHIFTRIFTTIQHVEMVLWLKFWKRFSCLVTIPAVIYW